jgi:hypothetical protein
LGKYKAVLNLKYGSSQQGTLQDIAYFWVAPWQGLFFGGIMLACLFVFIIAFSNARHRKNLRQWEEEMEQQRALSHPVVIKIPPANIAPRSDSVQDKPARPRKTV